MMTNEMRSLISGYLKNMADKEKQKLLKVLKQEKKRRLRKGKSKK